MSNPIPIRSSSIQNYAACARFFAYGVDPYGAFEAHPDLATSAKTFPRYKAVMGTAFHAAMEKDLRTPEEISKEVETATEGKDALPDFYDEKFTEKEQMDKIVTMMVAAFRKSPHSREWTIDRKNSKYEIALESTDLVDGVKWTGHVDCISHGKVIDLKTGAYVTPDALHIEQLTSYYLLSKQGGAEVTTEADVVKVGKPGTPKPRSDVKVARYSVDVAPHTKRVIRLVQEAAELVDSRDKWGDDLNKVPCNIHSKTCMYCPLRNTTACRDTQYLEVSA